MEQNEKFKGVYFDKKKYEKFMKYYREDVYGAGGYSFDFWPFFTIGFYKDKSNGVFHLKYTNGLPDVREITEISDKSFKLFRGYNTVKNGYSNEEIIFLSELKREFDNFTNNVIWTKKNLFLSKAGLYKYDIYKDFVADLHKFFHNLESNNEIISNYLNKHLYIKEYDELFYADYNKQILADLYEFMNVVKNDFDCPFLKFGVSFDTIFNEYKDKDVDVVKTEIVNSFNEHVWDEGIGGNRPWCWWLDDFINEYVENFIKNKYRNKEVFLTLEEMFECEQYDFGFKLTKFYDGLFLTGSLNQEGRDFIEFFYKNCRKKNGRKYTIVEIVDFLKDKCIKLFESDPDMYDNLFNDYEKEVKDLEKYIVGKDYKKRSQEKVLVAIDKVNLKSSVDDILNELPENFKVELFNVIKFLKNKEITNSEAYLLNALISKLIDLKKITSQEEVQKTVNKLLKMQHKYELRMLSEAITMNAMKKVEQGDNKRRR